MKEDPIYRIGNYIIGKNILNNIFWMTITFQEENKNKEVLISKGIANFHKDFFILIFNQKRKHLYLPVSELDFNDPEKSIEQYLKNLPVWKKCKYYLVVDSNDITKSKIFYTKTDKEVTKKIRERLIYKLFPEVFIYTKQVITERFVDDPEPDFDLNDDFNFFNDFKF